MHTLEKQYAYIPQILSYDDIAHNISDSPGHGMDQARIIIDEYLEEFAAHFTTNRFYEFGKNYYQEDEFLNFTHRLSNIAQLNLNIDQANERIIVIEGKAGIGKTSFLRQGLSSIINIPVDDILIRLSFRDVIQDHDEYYELIWAQINKQVAQLLSYQYAAEYNHYTKESVNISAKKEIIEMNDLLFLCKQIGKKHNRPLMLAFDDIDLCNKNTQEKIVSATIRIYDEINRCYKLSNIVSSSEGQILVILTKRPETNFRRGDHLFQIIHFPLPRILNIFLNSFQKSLNESCKTRGTYPIHLTFGGVEIKDINGLNDFFIQTIRTNLLSAWRHDEAEERFGSIEDFHNQIVNSNVRRFIHFFSTAIQFGGLKHLALNYQDGTEYRKYQLYQYVNFLIRGAFDFHPGNAKMDGEGFHRRSPIVMNLFDFREWISNIGKVIKNYFVYIRIIQYIEINYEKARQEVSYLSMRTFLIQLGFDLDVIETATKILLFANIVDETRAGVRNIAMRERYSDISLEPAANIFFSAGDQSTILFYLKHLIVEPEYLFNMAVTAPLIIEKADPLGRRYLNYVSSYHTIKERIYYCKRNMDSLTYLFIKSIFIAIRYNIQDCQKSDKGKNLQDFKDNYIYNNGSIDINDYKPWRRMLSQFILILNKKEKSEELLEIIGAAEVLQTQANECFNSFFMD